MKQDTKDRIIETGAGIIHHKGYHHTGIQEVLSAAGVPKGSFYFYFKNKEDFGLHVIDYFDHFILQMLKPVMEDDSLSALGKIEGILDHFIDLFKNMDYQCGCPIGNLSQEMGDLNEAFGKKLSESVEKVAKIYQGLLDQARSDRELTVDMDTAEMAEFIVTSWQGALIKMKINKSIKPLVLHKRYVFNMLTPNGAYKKEKNDGVNA